MKGGIMQMNSITTGALDNGEAAQQSFGSIHLGAKEEKTDMKHGVLFDRVSARLKAQVGPVVYASCF